MKIKIIYFYGKKKYYNYIFCDNLLMQFIQEHLVSNIEEIETTLNSINDQFQPSEVYHAQSDTKQVR